MTAIAWIAVGCFLLMSWLAKSRGERVARLSALLRAHDISPESPIPEHAMAKARAQVMEELGYLEEEAEEVIAGR